MKPKLWIYCYIGVQLFCTPVFAEQIELNGMQSLTIADMLQKNGENDKAKTTYYALLNDPDYKVRTESVFRLAQIATNEQDYTSAIKYYLHILKYYPNSVLARLELARAYFMNGDYSLAEEQFLFARATPNLPEPIVKNIDTFLTAIRKQKNWSVESYFSFVPDSNLNYASGAGEECINSSFGIFCRPLEKQDSGIGIRFGADASYYLRFTKNFGLKSTFSISGLEYSSSRYDDYSLRLAVGPRYTFTNGEISLQPNITWRWYQGAQYTNQYGLLLNTTWQFGRNWMLSGGVSWDKNSYINDYINKFLSGNSVQLYIQPRYYFDNKSFLMSGLSFGHSSAKMDAYGYNSVGFALGYYNQWPLGFATFLRGDVSFLHFLDEKFFIMEDYNNTTSTQSTVSKWLSTNGYKFFISVQLPAHLKSNNLDKSTRCLKKILKSIEKDLLGRRWHKHHLPFLIFAEKGEQNATFHFHILVCDNNGARNFDFFTFYWVVQRTIKKFGFNQQNIDCKEITETPEKLCGYVVKELVADNNHHVNSERIIPSTILFNL